MEDSEYEPAADAAAEEYVAFRVAQEEYCIRIAAVREIRRWTPATKLPHAPAHVTGVINLRGAVLPVIDFATRAGLTPTEPTGRHTVIILESRDQIIGLLVDSVSDILRLGAEALQPTPEVASRALHEIINGIAIIDDRMLRVLNVNSLSPRAEAAT